MVIVGSTDQAGRVWASILVGEPGFAQRAFDVRTVSLRAAPPRAIP